MTLGNMFQFFDPVKILIYVALLYFVFMMVLFVFQRHFIYIIHTPRAPISAFLSSIPAIEEVVVSPEKGLDIKGWFVPPVDKEKPVIVFFHGNASNLSMAMSGAVHYLHAGYGFLVAEYRGYSGNKGIPSEKSLYRDARAWLNFLKSAEYAEEQIFLFGESLGSGIAVQMAIEFPNVKAVVLISPYTRLVDVAQKHYPVFPVRFLMRDKYASIDKVGALKGPVYIIHGDSDAIVPVQMGHKLFEKINGPKNIRIVPGAGHNDLYLNGANAYILQFLQSLNN